MSIAFGRVVAVLVICLAMAPAAGQQGSAAARLLESPECGPARPGCKLPPAVRRQVMRQARLEALRDASAGAVAAMPDHAAPAPPPTPEDQIQPAYRDHGTVRPEFSRSGTVLR